MARGVVKFGYVNRDGVRIAREDWERCVTDDDYCKIKAYDNGKVIVTVVWSGKVADIDNTFQDMWKVFRLGVFNYNDLGVPVPDPVEDGKWFPDKERAIEAYEAFLLRWTNSHREDEGELIEEDNDLTPPPPPSLDAPESDIADIKGLPQDDVGVW